MEVISINYKKGAENMIQGIQSNYESYTQINSINTDNKIKTTTTDVEVVDGKISKTDTVEISAAGRLASEATDQTDSSDIKSLLDESESSSAAIALGTKKAPAGAPPAGAPASSSTESTEETETTILTTLTEEQLKDLVSDGTITQAEMNAELSRREASESVDEFDTDSDKEVIEDLASQTNTNLLDGEE